MTCKGAIHWPQRILKSCEYNKSCPRLNARIRSRCGYLKCIDIFFSVQHRPEMCICFCTLFCCGYVIYMSCILFIYLPMFSGLFVWTRSNRMVAWVPVKQPENHDDVINWKHFARYWPFVRGIHRSPVNSPHKGQWRGALMFTLICARINDWGVRLVIWREAWGWWFETSWHPFWRHRN